MAEDIREAKRARQACLNCRRKKTRCSGERPICAFCARLGQECRYENGRYSFNNPDSNQDVNLAARVAFLESRLSMLDSSGLDSLNTLMSRDQPRKRTASFSSRRRSSQTTSNSSPQDQQHSDTAIKFSTVPDMQVLRSAADIYFRHCHNQPYSYFVESDFRHRLEERSIPSYLLLAVMAVASRFSDDPFFDGQHGLAMEQFARTSWSEISEYIFSDDSSLEIQTVQATNMLAVLDFLAGRHQSAWVKIGLTVRFAQTLRLGEASEYDGHPPEAVDERRRTFWSVYLLDKLVSCGRHRPPMILDVDCTVPLPTTYPNEMSPSNDLSIATLTQTAEGLPSSKVDDFALTIFMASTLGRVLRYSVQQTSDSSYVPWDSKSEFASIYGILLSFETYSDALDTSFKAAFIDKFGSSQEIDFSKAGHFTFSHVLYHLNHCILHHPFLLRYRLKSCKTRVPPTFLGEALRRNKAHADEIISILKFVQDQGYVALPSFFAYCAVVAGFIQQLHATVGDQNVPSAQSLYQTCVQFLDQAPAQTHYKRMSTALRNFHPDHADASVCLTSHLFPGHIDTTSPLFRETMWNTFDYGWLCDSARPLSPVGPEHSPNFTADDWAVLSHIGAGGCIPSIPDMFSFTRPETNTEPNPYHQVGDSNSLGYWPGLMEAAGAEEILLRDQGISG